MELSQLTTALWRGLPPPTADLVRAVVAASPAPVYAAGGAVRDLLLGRPLREVDLVVEGDAIALAARVATRAGLRVTSHDRFGTAIIRARGAKVDLAMARTETYAGPGRLPDVSPASLDEDLGRRDFTINAMALPLTADGGLVDPYGGRDDCERRVIRNLHEQSFVDDPTRMFRACRYSGRIAFTIESGTERQIRRDAIHVDLLTPARLRNEVVLLLQESSCSAAFALAKDLGLLTRIHAALDTSPIVLRALDELPAGVPDRDIVAVRLALVVSDLGPTAVRELITRLALPRQLAAVAQAMPATVLACRPLTAPRVRPRHVIAGLESRPRPTLWAIAAVTDSPALRVHLHSFLSEWSTFRPQTPAADLVRRGLDGPSIGLWLRRLRDARVDGEVDAAGEAAWLDAHIG